MRQTTTPSIVVECGSLLTRVIPELFVMIKITELHLSRGTEGRLRCEVRFVESSNGFKSEDPNTFCILSHQ